MYKENKVILNFLNFNIIEYVNTNSYNSVNWLEYLFLS